MGLSGGSGLPILVGLALVLTACAGPRLHWNQPIDAAVRGSEVAAAPVRYEYADLVSGEPDRSANSEKLFVALAFSGGGTRSAALAYGVLEALRDVEIEVDGTRRSLLQEVDVISANSGGRPFSLIWNFNHSIKVSSCKEAADNLMKKRIL